MTATRTIKWAPLSEKHRAYIRDARTCRVNVAEGAIRSGKTIDNCIVAAMYLERTPDRFHLASGSTIGNAKLNIGDCNGFGLEHLFRGRCRWGKYKDNEALFIQTQTGEKIIIFTGGGKSDSYKRILGNSYGLWIATEINEHYDSDDSRSSFIKVAFGRQAAAKEPKVLWDLNPCNPHHRIYGEYIDRYRTGLLGGYQYRHFTLDDNLAITEARKAEIRSQYDPDSVWYRRDILGERCVAEGLIYQDFADHTDAYLIDDPKDWMAKNRKTQVTLMYGVDFGGTGSASKFQATLLTSDGCAVAIAERYMDHRKDGMDPDRLNRDFAAFVTEIGKVYGYGQTRADSAEQILIRGLQKTAQFDGLQTTVKNALKMPIKDRIKLELLLMSQGRLFVSRACPHLIDALQTAAYDPRKPTDERLDDGSSDIDSLDAFEYSIEPHFKALELAGHRAEGEIAWA